MSEGGELSQLHPLSASQTPSCNYPITYVKSAYGLQHAKTELGKIEEVLVIVCVVNLFLYCTFNIPAPPSGTTFLKMCTQMWD